MINPVRNLLVLIFLALTSSVVMAEPAGCAACGRYRDLILAGKNSKLVCVAIARELAGFIWAIVREEMPKVRHAANAG
nr:hypothetical protein [uncultured bacterium]